MNTDYFERLERLDKARKWLEKHYNIPEDRTPSVESFKMVSLSIVEEAMYARKKRDKRRLQERIARALNAETVDEYGLNDDLAA
jgi:hypothetical protein